MQERRIATRPSLLQPELRNSRGIVNLLGAQPLSSVVRDRTSKERVMGRRILLLLTETLADELFRPTPLNLLPKSAKPYFIIQLA